MAAEAPELTLFVTPTGYAGAIKALVAANLSGSACAVQAKDTLGLGADVAVAVGGCTLYGANAAARFFALSANALKPGSLQGDVWAEWENTTLSADVGAVSSAIAAGTAAFPLSAIDSTAAFVASDEKGTAMRVRSAAAPTKATTSADVVSSVQRLTAALNTLEAALTESGPYLTGADVTVGDVIVFGTVHFLVSKQVVSLEKLPAVAAFYAALSAQAPVQAAIEAANALNAGPAVPPVEPSTSMLAWLNAAFTAAIFKAYPAAEKAGIKAKVTTAGKFKHHYQCNSAMQLAGVLRTGDRRATAQNIIKAFPANDVVDRLEVAGPGFINVYMSTSFLHDRVRAVAKNGLVPPVVTPQKVIVDYSSPNIAKEMHVGHLRSTIIGDTIARLLEYVGHDVKRINHVGDWGTQFGMLIAHLKDQGVSAETEEAAPSIADLTKLYKAAKVRFSDETDDSFKKRAHQETFKLQSGDPENRRLWKALCAKSEEMFTAVYNRLGIDSRLKIQGESFYQQYIPMIVDTLKEKGLLTESDGALVAFVRPGDKPPLMIVKSDKAIGYDTTDMACIWYRSQKLKADRLVYVVDAGQSDHFENLFAGAQKAGWLENATAVHVKFGVVQGEDGRKFKTRSGDTVKLVDLLDKARDLCRDDLVKRAAEGGNATMVESKDFESTAEALGYGGVKYFDLRQNRLSDYRFNYSKMLAHNGDTAVYMQYAHARIASIGRKAGVDPASVDPSVMQLNHEAEINLAFQVTRFQEVVSLIDEDLLPNHLCEYLWKLATHFSDFYNKCHVVGVPEQSSRLVLCHAVAQVFRKCMTLLGINPIDRL